MTVAIPCHRALARKITTRSFTVVARLSTASAIPRVQPKSEGGDAHKISPQSYVGCFSHVATRTYATKPSAKPAGRPKAHTGREPAARRKTSATPKSASSKPGPKTSEGKSKVGRKPKSAAATSKPKAKTKPVKKALSKRAISKQKVQGSRDLRARALLDAPKKLPDSAWAIVFTEGKKPGLKLTESQSATKEAAEKFRNLSAEEKEHYNHLAHQNRKTNEDAYKAWLAKHTPDQIKDANLARRTLQKQSLAVNPDRKKRTNKFPPIKDDRLVHAPASAYAMFVKHRWASGDFQKMTVSESSKLIGREWKALSDADKKPYLDQEAKNRSQYVEEYRTVYGSPPTSSTKTKASSAKSD